jgi:hypothetical protein
LAIPLPADARVRNLVVRPHTLGDYDDLDTTPGEHDDDTDTPE